MSEGELDLGPAADLLRDGRRAPDRPTAANLASALPRVRGGCWTCGWYAKVPDLSSCHRYGSFGGFAGC